MTSELPLSRFTGLPSQPTHTVLR